MHALRAVNEEPIPGYRLVELLGKGGFGEVWKCQAPGGLTKAIKFVPGNHRLDASDSDAEQERRALDNVKSLRHPFLLSIERVELIHGDLLLVTELADRSLHDLLTDYKKAGQPGIPREEVLTYLREAAEVLDVLHYEHGLQHLDIKPRNLFLVGKHIKVADFGLVASLADLCAREELLSGITPLYAAPEIFERRATLFSDQYSLAVTYYELLTGELPFKARTAAQLAYLVATTDPDLSRLPVSDRVVVARALSREPRHRFTSCTEFVEALVADDTTVARSRLTTFEFSLGDTEGTAVVPAVKRSGVLRRESRVIPAGASPSQQTGDLSGVELLECLSRGPAGELWRARGPRQEPRLVRFLVPPDREGPAAGALDQLLRIRHAGLAQLQLVPLQGERVALISEAGDTSLANRLRDCRAAGQPGVPRAELLAYLGNVAHVLDEVYHKHQLQHLTLTPRHLALSGGEVILLEFGLAELLWLPQGLPPVSLSPRYAAVELYEGLISDACDQFSLALMFQELLVGLHPFRNLNARQMASPRLRGQADLSLLPAADRAIVTRALDPQPEKRFRSCAEFVLALEEASLPVERATVQSPSSRTVASARTAFVPAIVEAPWRAALEELIQAAGRGQQVLSAGTMHYRLFPGHSIEQRTLARLAPGMARLKMAGFREQWQAELISDTPSCWRLEIRTKPNLLQRCLGRLPGLYVEVVFGTARESTANLTPVRITIEPVDCAGGRASQILHDLGSSLLTSLQVYLGGQTDREAQERFVTNQLVQVDAPTAGLSVTGQLRDLGRRGLTFRSLERMPTVAVALTLNRVGSPVTMQIPARVTDCRDGDDDQYEIDVEFA